MQRLARLGVVVALAAMLTACQVRPLYLGAASGGALSPTPDLRAIVVDEPEGRTEQVLRNELLFLLRGDGGPADEERYRLRLITSVATDPLAVELEEDLPSAVLLRLNATFVLSEVQTGRTLLTGASTASASYDFSSQRFANVRAERDTAARAATTMAQNIASRIAAYFAARRSET